MSEHRIILVENQAGLSVELSRLKISRKDYDPVYIKLADIAVLVLHHPAIYLSHGLLNQLAQNGAVVISTDQCHMPSAIQIPLIGNTQHCSRLQLQIKIQNHPNRDLLWQQLIACRLLGQANQLYQQDSQGVQFLLRLVRDLQPGDPKNHEAQGARYFWRYWLEQPHSRDKKGANDPINSALNFAYAILRSMIARCVVAAGLHPALGVHHCNTENPFNLVDDLIEAYRFVAEHRVRELDIQEGLNPETKVALSKLVEVTVMMQHGEFRLAAAIQETVDSFVRALNNKKPQLLLPCFPELKG